MLFVPPIGFVTFGEALVKSYFYQMNSPQGYIEYCKLYSYEELIQEREELQDDIRSLEQKLFSGDIKDDYIVSTSPQVRYQVKLEYLAALSDYMQQRYNEEYVR